MTHPCSCGGPTGGWIWDGCGWVQAPSLPPQPPSGPFPPCPPFPPRPINGPIIGVTGGTAARPGEVGEYLVGSSTVSFVLNAGTQSILAQPLIIPPGDWDVQATLYVQTTVTFDGISFFLNPLPAGFTNDLSSFIGVLTNPPQLTGIIVSPRAQALVSIPTLMPFTINLFNTSGPGNIQLMATARRMR